MRFPQTWNAWKFAMFKNFIHSQLLKPNFLSSNRCETQIIKNYQTSKQDFFYRSIVSPFAVQLFLLPFSSHCPMQNIGFSDSGYVFKPPQPSSAIYGALPVTLTGHPKATVVYKPKINKYKCCYTLLGDLDCTGIRGLF